MINHIAKKAGEKAGISNANPALRHINQHILRHSIARYLKSKGFSAEWIQNFLGHASFKTTMDMYDTLSIHEMQEEVLRRIIWRLKYSYQDYWCAAKGTGLDLLYKTEDGEAKRSLGIGLLCVIVVDLSRGALIRKKFLYMGLVSICMMVELCGSSLCYHASK